MLQGGDEAGIKQSKKRITIFVVAAMDDVLERMVMINNSCCPRAFDAINQNPKRLPNCICWKSNRKSWMTTDIFGEWLVEFNHKMSTEKRTAILFLDNFSAYKAAVDAIDLSNTVLEVGTHA